MATKNEKESTCKRIGYKKKKHNENERNKFEFMLVIEFRLE